ncbi:trypsin-like serine protease [Conidiobolus coronatus NRRL 28638]|uniref:Trypsin-like serine protease n=1 Tax=Conidiobolus coronatus (strain ATCC 28846 / CBS 209.66 / NRRL 28638) TaxID=796925 RepID=A0A137P1Y3_CONC2|nr:trypsin-like serine protease [Conidiobolus coronatus NRRL 28638]|eukprot:KXN69022.1 trypsin-like serine protease [Conidiobolus coronatus NRRL 28638]
MTSVKLDEDEGTKAGDDVRFLGYGLLDSTYAKATKLHEVNLKLAEFDTCAKNWAQVPETLHPWQVCAGTRRQNACPGDSGAPLIKVGKNSNPNILVGINSFNAMCGRSDLPGVFTKVAYYKDFIRDTVLSREMVN